MAERETGTIKWFNSAKGYGFITRDQGGDVFLHYSAIEVEGFRSVDKGQKVEFSVTDSDKGPQAAEVKVVE